MLSSPNGPIAVSAVKVSKLYNLQAQQSSLRDAVSQALQRITSRQQLASDSHELWALKNINFVVRPGEALGIVGPNGAGKTTLLKVLSRVTSPTSGTIKVNGRISALIELGAGFHPDLTGRENVYLNGQILGLPREEIRRKFNDIVSFSGLERFIDTPVKRYSSGMYVRLGFAVAAHTDPEVLLVDEVLAVGDAHFRQKCIERIETLRRQNVSIIFISHNLFQVQAVCDTGIFLLDGQIQAEGSVMDAIAAYEVWQRKIDLKSSANKMFEIAPGHGGSDLKITTIQLFNGGDSGRTVFQYTDSTEIRIYFLAHHPVYAPNFVVRFLRADGLVCAMLRSAELDIKMDALDGKGYLAIRIPELQLTTGAYLLEVRLRDKADAVTLAKGQSHVFQVNGPGSSGGDRGGIFVPRVSRAETILEATSSTRT